MHSPESLQITPSIILPGDNEQIKLLKQKLNEVIKKLDEAYRLLHMDCRIFDMREPPPHASISHSAWKFVENKTNGDLELWHRSGADWGSTYWSVIGDLTRPPSA
jgi:predicted NACHT family NTPase